MLPKIGRNDSGAGMARGFVAFELDLMEAIMGQLIPTLDAMEPAPLTLDNARDLPDAQGVYLLIHDGAVRYVGKTDAEAGLATRLARHARKFEQRRNVRPEDVGFKAAQILVLTAMDIETRVIRHYDAEWNGSGFGSNDPGRNRELTDKAEQGFDARFPIDIDIPLDVLPPGPTTAHDALVALKVALPYTLRFELERGAKGSHAFRTKPHPDLPAAPVTIPPGPITVRDAMRLIVAALPPGWQATYFVSHVILYRDNPHYPHGTAI